MSCRIGISILIAVATFTAGMQCIALRRAGRCHYFSCIAVTFCGNFGCFRIAAYGTCSFLGTLFGAGSLFGGCPRTHIVSFGICIAVLVAAAAFTASM